VDRPGPDLFRFVDGILPAESVSAGAGPAAPPTRAVEWEEQPVRVRAFALVLVSLLMVGGFAVAARQAWTANSADARLVSDERARVAYLRPLVHLVGALTEAQSAAVRGAPADAPAVQSAVETVDTVDHRYGDDLGTTRRWQEVRQRITLAIGKPDTGRAGYDNYADVLTLALDLVRRTGDTSGVIRDPQLDSYYVLDTALLRLPEAIVSAGRAADLVLLTGKSTLSGADAIQAAVARHNVAQAAADANTSITQSISATNRSVLGADLAGQLDGFRAAVDEFAPLVILNALAAPIDADSLPPAAGQVRVTALALADAVLSELDGLLTDRDTGLRHQRELTTGLTIAVLVLLLLSVWLVIGMVRAARAKPEDPVVPAEPAQPVDLRQIFEAEELADRAR
jgi:hypothetical protein